MSQDNRSYYELLKDPRWQRKRLEILERDKFTCQHCKTTAETLHVHHKSYTWGNEPWNYPNDNFITLCEACHEEEELNKKMFNDRVTCLLQMGSSYEDLYEHLGLLLPGDNAFFENIGQ